MSTTVPHSVLVSKIDKDIEEAIARKLPATLRQLTAKAAHSGVRSQRVRTGKRLVKSIDHFYGLLNERVEARAPSASIQQCIDKIEELVRALRKHIVRSDIS